MIVQAKNVLLKFLNLLAPHVSLPAKDSMLMSRKHPTLTKDSLQMLYMKTTLSTKDSMKRK